MPQFRNALERAEYMVSEKIAVDIQTALLIGTPKPKPKNEEATNNDIKRKRTNNFEHSKK